MNTVNLKWRRSDGTVRNARVFLDDDGFVTSAYGLRELLDTVDKNKKVPLEQGGKAAAVRDFFDDTKPCPTIELANLRGRYRDEMRHAELAGCTSCQQAAITRKYQKLVMDQTPS